MSQQVTIQELIDSFPSLDLKPGADREFTVTDLAEGDRVAADRISEHAEHYGLFAFPPRGNEIRIFRPKRRQWRDESIQIGYISLD
jgi:hypothetical protein